MLWHKLVFLSTHYLYGVTNAINMDRMLFSEVVKIKVNYELLDLYWTLGEYIVKNQEQHLWGDAFIKSLAKDLQIDNKDRFYDMLKQI